MTAEADRRHMRHAIALASRGVGRTGRVPSVGCVLVAPDGSVVARGRTDEAAARTPRRWLCRGRRGGARRDGLCDARTLFAYRADRRPLRRSSDSRPAWRARWSLAAILIRAWTGRDRQADGGRDRRRCRDRGTGGGARPRRLLQPHPARPAFRHAEDRPESGRQDRDVIRRQQMDHRPAVPPLRTSPARAQRRDPGGHRHRFGRRSGTDLPHRGVSSAILPCGWSSTRACG